MFHHDMPTTVELFKIFGTIAIIIVIAALMTYFMLFRLIRNLRRGIHETDEESTPAAAPETEATAQPPTPPGQP